MSRCKGLWIAFVSMFLLLYPAYSQPLIEQKVAPAIDLSPVELVEKPIEITQNTTQAPASTAGSTTSQPTIAVPTISTSRPSFTDAVTTVPQGSAQFENGSTYTNYRGGTYSWTLP